MTAGLYGQAFFITKPNHSVQTGIFNIEMWERPKRFINTLIVDGRPKRERDLIGIDQRPQMGAVNIAVFLAASRRMRQLLK